MAKITLLYAAFPSPVYALGGLTRISPSGKEAIRKYSKDFGGTLDDPEVIKLIGCSRNSFYKYKREVRGEV